VPLLAALGGSTGVPNLVGPLKFASVLLVRRASGLAASGDTQTKCGHDC